ncbi:MerR family DNA-binding protein, partial [Acinetobacter baumannii]|nr:MerR family DNA-binding protein [Acinetobacter baumannii]
KYCWIGRVFDLIYYSPLNFLKHARELGFSSEQMKELISLWKNTDRHSVEVKALTVKHIAELKQKIAHLQEMVNILQASADDCCGDQQASCAILDHIEKGVGVS